jgi:hypothetical protein
VHDFKLSSDHGDADGNIASLMWLILEVATRSPEGMSARNA